MEFEEFLQSLQLDDDKSKQLVEYFEKAKANVDNSKLEEELKKALEDNEALKSENESIQNSLKDLGDLKPSEVQANINKLTEELKQANEIREAEKLKYKLELETQEFISKHTFVNDITKNHLASQINEALSLEENKGKSREDIFKSFTTDEKGENLQGIFAEVKEDGKSSESMQEALKYAQSSSEVNNNDKSTSPVEIFKSLWGLNTTEGVN